MLAELVRRPDAVVSVRSIAEENGVPYSFARAIQHDLVKAGIVEGERGAHGGMRLAVDPTQTKLIEVIEAMQGPIKISTCDAFDFGKPCPRKPECSYNPVWCNAERMVRAYFSSITLSQIVIEGLSPKPVLSFDLESSTK